MVRERQRGGVAGGCTRILGGNSFPHCFAQVYLCVYLCVCVCVANFLLHKFMFMMCAGGKMLLGSASLWLICSYCAEANY